MDDVFDTVFTGSGKDVVHLGFKHGRSPTVTFVPPYNIRHNSFACGIFRVVVGVHGVVGWRLVRGFPRAARAPDLVRFLPQLWVQRDRKNAASESTPGAGARTQRRRCSQSRSHFLGVGMPWMHCRCPPRHGATASEFPLACGMYVPHVPSVLVLLVSIATFQRCSRGRVVWECRRCCSPVPLTSTVTKLARF